MFLVMRTWKTTLPSLQSPSSPTPASLRRLPLVASLSALRVLVALVLWISVRTELRHTPLSQNNFRAGGSCARRGEVADGSHLLPEMCLTFCLGEQAVASNSLTLQAGSGFGSGLDLQACQAAGQSLWHAPVPGPEGGVWARLQLRECSPSRGVQDSGKVRCFRFFISPVGLRAPPSVGSVSTITSPCGHAVGEVEDGGWRLPSRVSGACTCALGVCFLTLVMGCSPAVSGLCGALGSRLRCPGTALSLQTRVRWQVSTQCDEEA